MIKKYKFISIGLLLLIFGAIGGYIAGYSYEYRVLIKKLSIIHPIRNDDPSYKFIDPLLAYVVPSVNDQKYLASLKSNISNFINDQKKANTITDASVFFSDLNRGRWLGINENQKYNPASMLKVVIMVAYFKDAEKNSDILKQYFVYTKYVDSLIRKDEFDSASNLKIGNSYTVENLIEKMIINSDNGAEILLLQNINTSSLAGVYGSLNISNPEKTNGDFTISPRMYSLFFRILYNSSYLNKDLSEKALEILSKTTFNDGLVNNLPHDIIVSHKFGEHVIISDNQIQSIELHDCGIVYYKDYPYFLCVMTKGQNLEDLKSFIKNISNLVYQSYSK